MKVLVFGATGVVGRPLVRMLHERGDTVIGTTRGAGRGQAVLAELGAEPVICDALDADAVRTTVEEHRPDAIVNQLTALGAPFNPRRYREWIAPTNHLRREGTRNLATVARDVGVERFVSQSIAFAYRWEGTELKQEADPLFDRDLGFADAVAALQELERLTLEFPHGVVLRYGWFYGPGTLYAPDGEIARQVRRRQFPIVGSGSGVFSFLHVEDAAAATVAALDRPAHGVFNIVDDDPAPMREWLPVYAQSIGAPRPWRVPLLLARLFAADFVVYSSVELRGADNARAREALGWTPSRPSWREGFLADPASETA